MLNRLKLFDDKTLISKLWRNIHGIIKKLIPNKLAYLLNP